MTRYIAEIVECVLDLACALTNHAGACWVLRHTKRLWVWAVDTRYGHKPHNSCPRCSRPYDPFVGTDAEWEVVRDSSSGMTGNSGQSFSHTIQRRADGGVRE